MPTSRFRPPLSWGKRSPSHRGIRASVYGSASSISENATTTRPKPSTAAHSLSKRANARWWPWRISCANRSAAEKRSASTSPHSCSARGPRRRVRGECMTWLDLEDSASALAPCRLARELNPADVAAKRRLGFALLDSGHFEDAAEVLLDGTDVPEDQRQRILESLQQVPAAPARPPRLESRSR